MLSVFQQSRFAPYFEEIKEVIKSGVLGKIHHISIKFAGYAERRDWQCSQSWYGASTPHTGPHPVHQGLDLLDTDDMPNVFSVLKKINSCGDAEDYAKLILTYPDRPLIDIEINSADAYNDRLYKIYAEKGSLKASVNKLEYKYYDDCPFPPLVLAPLTKEDGITPAYCSKQLNWHEVSRRLRATRLLRVRQDITRISTTTS